MKKEPKGFKDQVVFSTGRAECWGEEFRCRRLQRCFREATVVCKCYAVNGFTFSLQELSFELEVLF